MGFIKHMMELETEHLCTCDGGISLNINDHSLYCPAIKYIIEALNESKRV
jgi:hypothetical protein